MKKRIHLYVSGRVQGVCFRDYTKQTAETLGITGWVRNLPDRRVEAVFEGDDEAIEAMVAWCHRGSPAARVSDVDTFEETVSGEFDRFRILY